MRNKPKRPLELATLGALPTLALIATAMPQVAQAQVRGRVPTVVAPERQDPVIRRRTPAPESNCPDPIEARRAGRAVPAGCPGAQEEQAPVAVQYREQGGETPASDRGESRPVTGRRLRTTPDTPLADQPLNDGRVRRRIPGGRTPDDGAAQDTVPDRPSPVRRRDDYVVRTPDEVAPRREVAPDRPPPIRRRDDYVADTPDEARPPREITPHRPPPIRRRDDYVATTPDEVAPRRVLPDRRLPVAGEPVRPVSPVRPVTGGGLSGTPAGGVAGQIECIVPRANLTLQTNIPITMQMLCGFPGPGKRMTFRFQPGQWGAVSGAYARDSAARLTFGAPVDGVHPVISVVDGRQARVTAVCVPVYAAYNDSKSLTVGPKGEAAKPYRMWCTADGQVVRPIDMFWMTGSMFNALLQATVEDGPIRVSYFDISTPHILDTVEQLGLYPQLGTNWTKTNAVMDRAKVDNQYAGPGGFEFTYAEPPLTGPVQRCVMWPGDPPSGICRGYWRASAYGGPAIFTSYSAFAPAVIRSAAQRPAKPSETKEIYYTLMPGIIPVQHRAEAGGACRLIVAVEVNIRLAPGKVGVGYSDENRPRPNAPGTVTGVASAPYTPAPPKADDCS